MTVTRPGASLVWLAAALGLFGCRDQDQRDIPNRVLDRPTDVTLICAQIECTDADGDGIDDPGECTTVSLPLNICEQETGSCASDNPHLVGFVANSERNEIAMFTKCANRLVDMNVELPGYNFIPAGILPTDLEATSDGCRVFSANVGSCDLTVLDAPALAGFGLGDDSQLGRAEGVDESSSLISTLVPQTFDPDTNVFRPLGARPGQLISVPSGLSQAPDLAPGQPLEGTCDPLVRRSAYVSFPTCNLVAEIDLRTGNVLESRKFRAQGDAIVVEDAGVSPICPVECPVQFDAGALPPTEAIDDDGPFPQALALALEPMPPPDGGDPTGATGEPFDAADEAIEGQQLFVGGLGSDVVFEIPINDSGVWDATSNQVLLSDAAGVKQIRLSPGVNAPIPGSPYSQFMYVVAGDGSTRVVARPLGVDVEWSECETQLDPSLITAGVEVSACIEVSPAAVRRGFVRGPGIRPGRGEEVSDWMFRKVYEGNTGNGPFAEAGTVAVGVTTGGAAVYAMINQQRASGTTTVEGLIGLNVDPANVMDVFLFPHSMWPDPTNADSRITELPRVQDAQPSRSPSSLGSTHELAPTLRRVDAAYAEDDRASAQLDVIGDLDQLGGGRIYDEDVVRAVIHDYRSWTSFAGPNWSLDWEGTIPGTPSTTGRIDCELDTDQPHCILADSTANFCENGVLAGDKIVLVGCRDDDDCGDGRRCLLEQSSSVESTGICISSTEFEDRADELRAICGDFIADPCGEAYREYTIVAAYEDELEFVRRQRPAISALVELDGVDACPSGTNNYYDRLGDTDGVLDAADCECLPGFGVEACGPDQPGDTDGYPVCCPDDTQLLSGQAPVFEREAVWTCTDNQPDGGCDEDDDCSAGMCVDSRCRVPCEGSCYQRQLPSADCFGEFVRYQVQLQNAFRVSGPGLDFVSARVEADEGTGECVETDDVDVSQLLTSRLPLPASDDPDYGPWSNIPVCPGDEVLPSDPNPCRVLAERSLANKFHVFEYESRATVSALRFSNPVLSLLLDLTALESLTSDVPGYDDSVWPVDFVGFRRSRIPRGYRLGFGTEIGYSSFADYLTLEGRLVTYPIRIVPAPQPFVAFIVDGSGPGSTSSIRGQVLRVTLGTTVEADPAFTGVR